MGPKRSEEKRSDCVYVNNVRYCSGNVYVKRAHVEHLRTNQDRQNAETTQLYTAEEKELKKTYICTI